MKDIKQFLLKISYFIIFIIYKIPFPAESHNANADADACDYIIPFPAEESCNPVSCDPNHGPRIRFPFRLQNRHPARCGYPGFDLHCNARNQTVLSLPRSGDFIVAQIDYLRQVLVIRDPDSCLANRALNFSLSGSPFRPPYDTNLAFLNCSRDHVPSTSYYYDRLLCLGDAVVEALPWARVPPPCRRIANVSVPPWFQMGSEEYFEVYWSEPYCNKCEGYGGICRFKDYRVGCSKPCALSRSFKIGVIIGCGLPCVLCMLVVAAWNPCFSCGMKLVFLIFKVKVWPVQDS